MAKKIRMSVSKAAMNLILWAAVLFLAVDSLAKFNLIDLTGYLSPILVPLVVPLFILLDVGIHKKSGRKDLNLGDWILVIISGLSLLGVLLLILNLPIAFLTTAQGLANLVLGVAVIWSIFKK